MALKKNCQDSLRLHDLQISPLNLCLYFTPWFYATFT